MSTPISSILNRKGRQVVTIGPEATVYEAIARMVEHNVGSIVVVHDQQVVGIFTERDYLRRIALQGRTSKTTQIREVMTANVLCVGPRSTVEECMALMTRQKCRHLPVLDGTTLVGLISIGDCVRAISEQARAQVDTLTHYVAGSYPA